MSSRMPETDARKTWTKLNTTRIILKLNNNTDAAIIEKLQNVPSKQGYIKELIRKDLQERK